MADSTKRGRHLLGALNPCELSSSQHEAGKDRIHEGIARSVTLEVISTTSDRFCVTSADLSDHIF